jgi:hypothetical protein
LISFQGNHYYYVHGHAHGYGSHRISYTWLWEEKRELKASDLFDDKTGWRKKIRALVAQKKKEWENSSSGTSLVEPGSDVLFSPDQWSIEKEGMGVWLYMNNFAEATLIDIDWKPLNPYLSKKGRSLIFE